MPFDYLACPACGTKVKQYKNPLPTVDVIIELPEGIVLIERRNEPFGWAIPGGFVDYGESLEAAAAREMLEETSLEVTGLRLLGCYSDPSRDTRSHNISTVYVATAAGTPKAGDDAANLAVFPIDKLPQPLCFDHGKILSDYRQRKEAGTI
ncbi:NUDIX hydrolase [Citrifermentans bemidjiense Bem]|uniref:NUDIX hydrolase n=1 Tax=Citrifermentans bemidjiense (strain ATCC BAA-1014 / DSM 16622 / JCM 12645 / Bem) TaxID=404380 RepID=B5E8J8_CITBB|nr:NUDIX hydrolase [Citrifermentans bemidjiense]ACH38583.1 NUDIX hydrolase [Citrifermentans bemidjiense Bem]